MSFIRCLSNPEGLYMWGSGRLVTVSHEVKKPHSSGGHFNIPEPAFRGCVRKHLAGHDPASYRGVRVEEVHVDKRTGEPIPDWRPCGRGCKKAKGGGFIPCRRCSRSHRRDVARGWFAVRLSYGGHFVNLWTVTWAYAARRAAE